jgi:Fic family protein
MDTSINKNPFNINFLSKFFLNSELFLLKESEIRKLDDELNLFEQVNLDPDIEKRLISKNELLASFAISKAENSQLTLEEAESVYKLIVENKELDFINLKISEKKKLTQKDLDKLEFFNIAKTFKVLNSQKLDFNSFNVDYIKKVHFEITKCLDIFSKYLSDFTVYKSGVWRDNNKIRVGEYEPVDFVAIPNAVEELVKWLKNEPSITNIAIFHNALYAIHPFNNGNKRVCRILEHILLKSIGLNNKNLYSTSYYYHQEKARYYKYLLGSLERKNLNIFTPFILEAIVFSILDTVKTSLEIKKYNFLQNSLLDKDIQKTFKPLVKRQELQFKNFYNKVKKKISKQTFVNYLDKAITENILIRRTAGKATYYRLNIETEETVFLDKWLKEIQNKVSYINDDLKLI